MTRQDLSAVTPVSATLGYAGSYQVTGQGSGTLTWLPSPGRVIGQGHALYRVDNGSPVVLLYGSVPDWRAMQEGIIGQDVSQLNYDLVHLGYASRADIASLGWDYYSWETAVGVQNLEEHLGVTGPPGTLSLGQVVFEPQALRVSQVSGSLGGTASGPVLTTTSDQHVVTIPLDVAQQSQVQATGQLGTRHAILPSQVRHTGPKPFATRPWPSGSRSVASGHGATERRKTCWRTTAPTASFPEAVQENEEVVPVNVSTWVLPLRGHGRTIGRPGAPFKSTPERHDHAIHF